MTAAKVIERKDVPQESRWNDTAVFASWDEWRAEAEAITADLPQLSAFDGKLAQGSPALLRSWLALFTALDRRIMRLWVHAGMASSVDANDMTAKEQLGLLMGLFAKFQAVTAFAEPALLELDQTLLTWAKEEPQLSIYEHYFDDLLRQKDHRRSAEVEEILGMLTEPFYQTYRTALELTNLDMTFPDAVDSQGQKHPVVQATVPPTGIQDPDRELRRTAWENYCDGYLSLQNTLASNYINSVKQNVFLSRVRGYNSVLEAKLAPHHMPVEVFHNLIDTYKANIGTWHRYWEAKRRILGVDELHPYDIWAPIVQNQPVVPYQEGVEMISAGMAPLGDEYVSVMRRGCLQDRWVDYAPNAGKAQGAASRPSFDTPPFIFTSYNDTLMAMSILAHELGHSMHGYLTDANQPHVYNGIVDISMSAAETASNFNQALVRAHLMETRAGDPIFQMTLIDEAIYNFHRYFFIMPTLARFEFEVHTRAEQGQPLTAAILNDLMADLYAEGYGESMVDDRQRTAITWAQFGHLYEAFYTFQYAIGISAAHALAAQVLSGSSVAVDNYLNFLKAGSSLYTMDLFQLAGADMTSPAVVEKSFAVLADLVDRLENLTP